MVCPLDTAAVTELWRLDLFSCTSSSFLCAGTLSQRGKCCYFLREVKSGVDKHLFQTVSLITSITLPLNNIFVLLLANVRVIPKQKQLSTVENTKENLIHRKTKTDCVSDDVYFINAYSSCKVKLCKFQSLSSFFLILKKTSHTSFCFFETSKLVSPQFLLFTFVLF